MLASLLAGGVSPSSGASTGDSSAGLDLSFNYNAAFQVGGSGRQTQDAGLTASPGGGGSDSMALYVVGGIAAVTVIALLAASLRK
jgi:hypothetical protein